MRFCLRDGRYSDLLDRTIHDERLAQGEERLRDKTGRIMRHQPDPLPADVLAEMDRMAAHWK